MKHSAIGLMVLLLLISATKVAAQQAPTLHVHHITLSVQQIDSLTQWYIKILGCRLIKERRDSNSLYARLELNGFFIDMLQIKGSFRPPTKDLPVMDHMKAQGYRHLVLEPDNLVSAHQYLLQKGIVFFGNYIGVGTKLK